MKFISVLCNLLVVGLPVANVKASSIESDYNECMDFLVQNMPQRDVGNVPDSVLNESVTYALLTRHSLPFSQWTADIPFDIFQNYVLPYCSLSEARDNWRKLLFETLVPTLNELNTSSSSSSSMAVNLSDRSNLTLFLINNLNRYPLFDNKEFTFVANQEPMRISTFEVLSYAYASCTGYSIFFASILRSIGIPARVTGVPQWNCACAGCNCTSAFECNHNWIEIYDNNHWWSFTDAFPSGATAMNDTWFVHNASCSVAGDTNHSIYAASFAPTDGTHFIMEWDYGANYVPAWDVSLNYHI